MNTNKLVYDVREALREYSDDSELSDRYIIYLYDIKRAKYLRQELNDPKKSVDISVKQTLCVEVEEVDINECGMDSDCETIYRTARVIPSVLQLHQKSAITKVSASNRLSKPYNFITSEQAVLASDAPFPNSIFAFLHTDGRVYFQSQGSGLKLLECVTITGVFEHPLELSSFKKCCSCEDSDDNVCFDISASDYPIQPHIVDIIKSEIINELLNLKQVPEDKTNDSDDN